MADGPYTEGWPKIAGVDGTNVEVVPLADAERLRKALEDINNHFYSAYGSQEVARAALHPERGK